jgi:hypothetical protein
MASCLIKLAVIFKIFLIKKLKSSFPMAMKVACPKDHLENTKKIMI